MQSKQKLQLFILGAILGAMIGALLLVQRTSLFRESPVGHVYVDEASSVKDVMDIIFIVADASYNAVVEDGSTVYDAMTQLRGHDADFDFGGKEFIGIGFFVETINGIANDTATQYYWTLYINDEEAKQGVSDAVLHAGDIVEWKYEKRDF